MVDGKILVEKLIRYAKTFLHLKERDEIYVKNNLLREFKLDSPTQAALDLSAIETLTVPDILVEEIETYAKENNLCEEGYEELYSTYIMGLITPYPSVVTDEFRAIKAKKGVQAACDYLYDLGVKNNYIKKTAIEKNVKWEYKDKSRILEITINLSKPEKNNKDIAKLLTQPTSKKYPACLLCKENEGFQGTLRHPARENLRTIPVTLGNEQWFVQYSPYAYYNEHMIAFSATHTPMHIKADTVAKVLDFVDYFPNYMIGSNAALPIVGGSILDHEHFQGGGHKMPMHRAPVKTYFNSGVFGVKVGIVDWYNSVVRITSKNRKKISEAACKVIAAWEKFTDDKCGIYAFSDGEQHNTCSPVCRKEGRKYIMDIILRNNRTSEEYPDGIFHAHPEYHNIKKEGIGLIEAMGLYILPGRLKKQLAMIAEIVAGKVPYDENELNKEDNYLYAHRFMIKELLEKGTAKTLEKAEQRVTDKVNDVCRNILMNTAVFKDDETGKAGFKKFMKTCGFLAKGEKEEEQDNSIESKGELFDKDTKKKGKKEDIKEPADDEIEIAEEPKAEEIKAEETEKESIDA